MNRDFDRKSYRRHFRTLSINKDPLHFLSYCACTLVMGNSRYANLKQFHIFYELFLYTVHVLLTFVQIEILPIKICAKDIFRNGHSKKISRHQSKIKNKNHSDRAITKVP